MWRARYIGRCHWITFHNPALRWRKVKSLDTILPILHNLESTTITKGWKSVPPPLYDFRTDIKQKIVKKTTGRWTSEQNWASSIMGGSSVMTACYFCMSRLLIINNLPMINYFWPHCFWFIIEYFSINIFLGKFLWIWKVFFVYKGLTILYIESSQAVFLYFRCSFCRLVGSGTSGFSPHLSKN